MRIAFNFCKQWRLALLSELSENELSCLLEEKNAENKKATKTAVNVFRQQVLCRSKKERRGTYIKRKIK
jgi:hypothetical protein